MKSLLEVSLVVKSDDRTSELTSVYPMRQRR